MSRFIGLAVPVIYIHAAEPDDIDVDSATKRHQHRLIPTAKATATIYNNAIETKLSSMHLITTKRISSTKQCPMSCMHICLIDLYCVETARHIFRLFDRLIGILF